MKTFLAQNQFISNPSVISPRTERSAAAVLDPSGSAAAAAPNSALASAMTADTAAAPDLTDPPVAAAVLIAEPSSNEGRPKSAPALDAPNAHDDAGATDCISEIFFYARRLMKQQSAFILDEGRFLAEIEETPLFIRENGYLQRQA